MSINTSDTTPNQSTTEPNAGLSDPTDGREQYKWESKYPDAAKKEIRFEFGIILFFFFISLSLLFMAWVGWLAEWLSLSIEQAIAFKKYLFYASSGMLGGIIFGTKFFYRVVARGYWHMDRRYWRIMTPFIAMIVAFIVGTMIEASMISAGQPFSGAKIIAIGFLAGYFADEAVGKMYDIASVIFGKTVMSKHNDEMPKDKK